jgi:hypothetical protein
MSRKHRKANGATAPLLPAPAPVRWPFGGAGGGHAPRRVSASPPEPPTAVSPDTSPAPEARAFSSAPEPAPAPAAAPPAAPPAPAALDPDAAASNQWRTRVAARDAQEFAARRPMPQGETMLVQAWLQVLRVKGVPPTACTIIMRRSEPAPMYDFMIPGEAVAGAHPDRELFDYVERNRRQADIPETFVGRIQATTAAGDLMDLGWGHLYLAPRPPTSAPNPWSGPQAPGWGGGAAANPGGAPPGWGAPNAPAPGGGPSPAVMGGRLAVCSACSAPVSVEAPSCPRCGQPFVRMGAPGAVPPYVQAAPAPPAAPASTDPIVLELYRLQLDAHKEMMRHMGQTAPAAPAAPQDPWTVLERAVGLVQKLRPDTPAPAPEGPAVTVTKLDGGGAIVTNRDGVDKDTTTMLIAKDAIESGVKRIADSIAKVKLNGAVPNGAGGAVGGHAPRRVPGGTS